MTDLDTLERDLLAQVEAAPDEAALDGVRVAALGKKGAVSELLKTLGAMTTLACACFHEKITLRGQTRLKIH